MTLEHSMEEPVKLDYIRCTASVQPHNIILPLQYMAAVALLSGFCVAACLPSFGSGTWFWIVVHVLVFGATLGLAVRSGHKLGAIVGRDRPREIGDCLAGVGLAMIGIAPAAAKLDIFSREKGMLLLGVAYALMGLTAFRHRRLYRTLATIFKSDAAVNRGFGFLGSLKTVYECFWLLSCSSALIGSAQVFPERISDVMGIALVPAFFGLIGFSFVWLMMVVVHANAVRSAIGHPTPSF